MDSNSFQLHLATVPVIDDILRDGARLALQAAIEREVDEYIQRNSQHVDDAGHRLVVRNGHHPARKIQTGNGAIEVHQPRVNDKRIDEHGERIRFTSQILPPYLRKTKAIEELVPWLYLKGISTSDFPEALSCLGHDGSGLSPTSIVRMKEVWQGEYENFCRRSLEGKRYVYLWADGIYFNIRLTDHRPCVLVLMGALEDGTKELIAMIDGQRESEQSWLELLIDVKSRGLPGDGFQTGGVSPESLAKTQRQRVVAGGNCTSDLQRWNEARRLKLSRLSTTFGNSSHCKLKHPMKMNRQLLESRVDTALRANLSGIRIRQILALRCQYCPQIVPNVFDA